MAAPFGGEFAPMMHDNADGAPSFAPYTQKSGLRPKERYTASRAPPRNDIGFPHPGRVTKLNNGPPHFPFIRL